MRFESRGLCIVCDEGLQRDVYGAHQLFFFLYSCVLQVFTEFE